MNRPGVRGGRGDSTSAGREGAVGAGEEGADSGAGDTVRTSFLVAGVRGTGGGSSTSAGPLAMASLDFETGRFIEDLILGPGLLLPLPLGSLVTSTERSSRSGIPSSSSVRTASSPAVSAAPAARDRLFPLSLRLTAALSLSFDEDGDVILDMLYVENLFDALRSSVSLFLRAASEFAIAGGLVSNGNGVSDTVGEGGIGGGGGIDERVFGWDSCASKSSGSAVTVRVGGGEEGGMGLSTREYRFTLDGTGGGVAGGRISSRGTESTLGGNSWGGISGGGCDADER